MLLLNSIKQCSSTCEKVMLTQWGHEASLGITATFQRSRLKDRAWSQSNKGTTYQNCVLDIALHGLFLLSCPASCKACPVQAATFTGLL